MVSETRDVRQRHVNRARPVVSLIELLQGARSPAQLRTAHDFVNQLEIRVLPVTEIIGNLALSLLFTGNVRHFRAIRGLKIKPFRHSGIH